MDQATGRGSRLIDAHCHFRDPGYTHEEDFYNGTVAAASGGN